MTEFGRKKTNIYIIRWQLAVFLLIVAQAISMAQDDCGLWDVYTSFPKRETRAVWVGTIGGIDWPRKKVNLKLSAAQQERDREAQKQELINMLNLLKQANINTILLQTRVRGSVIYPSDIEPWDDGITGYYNGDPGYDPLDFAIEECHKRGMELHTWLVTIPVGTSSKQKKLGSKSVTHTHPELCKTVKGETFMLPGKEGTAEYVAELCKEIATKYDIDGISLDYIRYPEKEYNFSDDELYRNSTVSQTMSKADWRRANISRIVKAVHDAVKPLKPWVKLSSSPLGRYDDLPRYPARGWDCYNAVYQDPKEWLENNWQDELFPMMYFQGNLFYPFVYNWKEISYGHPVSAGLGIYFLDPKEGKKWTLNDVRAQIHAARDSEMGGICFYRSYYLTNNFKGIYNSVCKEFFPHPSLPQQMTWMNDSIIPDSPTSLKRNNGYITWIEPDRSLPRNSDITYNVYASFTSPVDITRGENLVAARVRDLYAVMPDPTLYYAVTAMNRFGTESEPIEEFSMLNYIQSDVSNNGIRLRKEVANSIKQHFAQPVDTKNSKSRKKNKKK